MEELMEKVPYYGALLGLFTMSVIFIIMYFKVRKEGMTESNSLLPFTAVGSVFSTVGISIMIQSAYYHPIGKSSDFFLGLAFNIPIVILFIINVYIHIKDTKEEKIYEQEKKYKQW